MRTSALLLLLSATAWAQEPPQLTAAQQIEQASGYFAKMGKMEARVNRLADQARRDKDIVQLNCVNDKLAQLRGHVAVAKESLALLRLPATQSDLAARNHEHTKVTLTYQKALVLTQEAETCVGEELRYVGPTEVEVDVDSNIPRGDPTDPAPVDVDLERPPEASSR